nr:putative replication associated protein [Crucivirus sp.]
MSDKQNAVYRLSWTFNKSDAILWQPGEFEGFHEEIKYCFELHCPKSKFIFQLEISPTTQRLHYQGHINLNTKLRPKEFYNRVKGILRGLYVTPSSNAGEKQAEFYCLKEESRVAGPWADKDYIFEDFSDLTEPTDWQVEVKNILLGPADPRTIYWIWETEGCTGKSSFATYMEIKHKIIGLGLGKAADNFYACSEMKARGYIFDVPRTQPNSFDWSEVYMSLEKIKDRNFLSTKYKPKKVLLPVIPHVVVFANQAPDKKALSMDRWKIFKIVNKNLIIDNS